MSDQQNLSFGFPDFSPEKALARRADLEGAVARLRERCADPNSPIREIRHQPARPAQCVPMPASVDARLKAAFEREGIDAALHSPGRGIRDRRAGQERGGRHADRERQDALLQPSGTEPAARRARGAGDVPVSDQGAGDGPAPRVPDARSKRSGADIRAFTYDGDTPQDARRAIRERASVVLTNPDMLHAGILPHHTQAGRSASSGCGTSCWTSCTTIAASTAATWRTCCGGCKRICEFYGSTPQFICSLGHHRQSQGTGRGADRRAVRAGGPQRRPQRREVLRLLQPAGGEPHSSASGAATCTRPGGWRSSFWTTGSRRWCSRTTGWPPRSW